MRPLPFALTTILFATLFSCSYHDTKGKSVSKSEKEYVYEKEPADSADFKHLTCDFYLSKDGQLCERKLVLAKSTPCNCNFEVHYDSIFSIYTGDTIIEKPLNTIVDIDSFVWLDSSAYSKDKRTVFYFYHNSDGGIRLIVDKADPLTFKRLCGYHWGIDKNYVFYENDIVKGLNIKHLQIIYPSDTSDHFVYYIRDDKNVFYKNEIVKGADANTFKVVRDWEAEDKNYKYVGSSRKEH